MNIKKHPFAFAWLCLVYAFGWWASVEAMKVLHLMVGFLAALFITVYCFVVCFSNPDDE